MRSMTIVLVIIGVGIVAGAYIWGKHMMREPKHTTVRIRDHAIQAEVEDTALGRAQGLSGRESLEADKGMLFVFSRAGDYGFWMKDMRFAIDIVWIDGGKVVGLSENLQPEPEKSLLTLTVYRPPEPAKYVLEIPAGTIARYGFQVGDEVQL